MIKKIFETIETEVRTLRGLIYYRFFGRPDSESIVGEFNKLYYNYGVFGGTWKNTFWLGTRVRKYPTDLWVYQEIIFKLKPDVIIECGTGNGGSALFLASIFDLVDRGKVLTIDIKQDDGRPRHRRITYLTGSSTSDEIVKKVGSFVKKDHKVMVILDSDHHKEHVLKELRIYSKFVTKGSYLIVEDTNLNGHPVEVEFGPGPMEAVGDFLNERRDFVVDKEREKLYLTSNPRGYLRRVR
ncbi:class I SAM-dependent methyltransferase [Candidatus Micrarchaeota archaeon]|nr:class I SAM-dependent methyltransferase [Candidatus Micrarchaeota archaeon]